MLEFKTERISDRVTRIFAFCTELMYLVEGDHTAALLDTGSGFGLLREAVEKLTDKPVIVLLTHGHVDHALGSAEFDTVYMSRRDHDIFAKHGLDTFRRKMLAASEIADQVSKEEYIPTDRVERFHDLRGGDTFDLGGVNIDIFDAAGHTQGSVAMLIREERMLLLGDACNYFTFLFEDYSLGIREYRDNLIKLKEETEGSYDTVLLSHGDGQGVKDMISCVLTVCDDIIRGQVDDVPFDFFGAPGLIAKAQDPVSGRRLDGGHGNIVYNKQKI